ncbi:STAS domain-containing protein [Streptomyces sp. NBC_01178]|uniref:STAS domain-containing protein n=1 Tax=Streptomyces sp. NBC_01178 TaxID=2903762 RepID=UPI00386DD506|nr:STAS domain-containing protein [Streptomyces sp. NBC_01178]
MDAPHAVGGPRAAPGRAALEVSPLSGRAGIRARGEISALTRPCWEQALSELARRHAGVSYVELSDVAFVDLAGVTALVVTAVNLPDGRVVVENPPQQLPRVLEMFWPGLDRIEVAL